MNIFSDNKNFYPTPDSLIAKMWKKVDTYHWNSPAILEPSAGKGDIVDYLSTNCKYGYKKGDMTYYDYRKKISQNMIDTIECDDTLRNVLRGKNYILIDSDFIHFKTFKHYDLIIMNPPFNEGDKHLAKAIRLLENNGGGQCVCLLNADTLRNPYSYIRKFLLQMIVKYNADVEYLENAFSEAERRTNVEVAMVYINVPEPKVTSEFFENLDEAEDSKCTNEDTYKDIVSDNYMEQAVSFFNREVEAVTSFITEYIGLLPYVQNSLEDDRNNYPYLQLKVGNTSITKYSDINTVLETIRYKYWDKLFKNKEFTSLLNNDIISKLNSKVSEMKKYDFSLHNIKLLQSELKCEMMNTLDDTIMNLFYKLTAEHTYYDETSQNIHYFNGWKTNKAHKIGKKVIIPFYDAFNRYDASINTYHITSFITEIEKTLNYVCGKSYSFTNPETVTRFAAADKQNRNIHFKYFDCTFYKKGTCHITFTNQDVVDALNIYAARHNNWLPPSYGKVAYADMTAEEKSVIDDFQGEEEYAKVFANPSQYIFETSKMLSLPESI